jgi:predicted RNA-binding protein YlxR (DUF448 family)
VTQTSARAHATAAEQSKAAHRRCIATGEFGDRASLLRFVVGPDGTIVPDIEARLPGRGLWLLPRRDIVERAVAKRLFARAARQPVTMPPELADRVEALLARRCGDELGLARKAGLAVAGFERVGEAVRAGRVGLLLSALDAAETGRRKLAAQAPGLTAAALTGAELGAAFGRDRVVHVAVGRGPLCRRLVVDLERLAGFRAGAWVEPGTGVAGLMDFIAARPRRHEGGTGSND